jgi:hypothetical protein
MKVIGLLAFLGMITGCATSSSKTATVPIEKEINFTVEPSPETRVVIFHVQTDKFSPSLQREFEQAMANLAGKCWIRAVTSYKETASATNPEYCVRFVSFNNLTPLKPYKRKPTDKKILLTALNEVGSVQVQKFVWDGAELRRVRNSDSKLQSDGNPKDRFENFLILWALK